MSIFSCLFRCGSSSHQTNETTSTTAQYAWGPNARNSANASPNAITQTNTISQISNQHIQPQQSQHTPSTQSTLVIPVVRLHHDETQTLRQGLTNLVVMDLLENEGIGGGLL